MSGIPVTITLTSSAFNALEQIAHAKGVTMRQLIEGHIAASLDPDPYARTITATGRPLKRTDVDAWVEAARMGVTNTAIAERYGVSKSLVSRYLRERGIHRQRPSERAA